MANEYSREQDFGESYYWAGSVTFISLMFDVCHVLVDRTSYSYLLNIRAQINPSLLTTRNTNEGLVSYETQPCILFKYVRVFLH